MSEEQAASSEPSETPSATPRKVCVTGASGFLGRHLIQQLVELDGCDVVALCRNPDPGLRELGAEVIQGSVLEVDELEYAFEGCDVVYHLAGRVERLAEHAHKLYEVHVRGTLCVIEAMKRAGVRRMVYASSSGVVGVSKEPALIGDRAHYAEDIVGRWPYYLSKIYAEKAVRKAVEADGLDAVIMRPTLLLGPGDIKGSSTNDVLHFMRNGLPIAPQGGMSFVDVRDAASAFRAAAERGETGACYLVGGINLTVRDFYDRLARITGQMAPLAVASTTQSKVGARVLWALNSTPFGDRVELDPVTLSMAHHYWYIDWTAAVADLGFAPRDPGDTLYDTVEWLRQNVVDRPRDRAFGDAAEPKRKRRRLEPATPAEMAERGERWARRIGGAARTAAQVATVVGKRVAEASTVAVSVASEVAKEKVAQAAASASNGANGTNGANGSHGADGGLDSLLQQAMQLQARAQAFLGDDDDEPMVRASDVTTYPTGAVPEAPAYGGAIPGRAPIASHDDDDALDGGVDDPEEVSELRDELLASLESASPEQLHAALWAVRRAEAE